MKVTKRQLRRIIKEEKQNVLLEQGDPISDVLLGDFVTDLAAQLMDSYEPQDIHRIGSEEEFYEAVTTITVEVEDLVRQRLADLWSGDLKLELMK